jgi:hypothetical protein
MDGFDAWARDHGMPETVQIDGDEVVVAPDPEFAAYLRGRADELHDRGEFAHAKRVWALAERFAQ